jgi:hypothetical protein
MAYIASADEKITRKKRAARVPPFLRAEALREDRAPAAYPLGGGLSEFVSTDYP